MKHVVPLSIRSTIGEYLNSVRLHRVPREASDFSRLAVLQNVDVRSILNDKRLNSDWADVHGYIQSAVLAGQRVPFSPNFGDLRAIYYFVRHLKPRRVLEIGTGSGVAALYIGAALKQNAAVADQPMGTLTTVDIANVNDRTIQPFTGSALSQSPREAALRAGLSEIVFFKVARSYKFLADTKDRFHFVLLDGSTAAADVYRDLQSLNQAVELDAVVLLHVFFPQGLPLWEGEPAITGPWRAVKRFQDEGALLKVCPLHQLPWSTKMGGHTTSLALVGRGRTE